MKIGVLDTDGAFLNPFFVDKKITIIRKEHWNKSDFNAEIPTHSEVVCSHILKENPEAEIVLITIVNNKLVCTVQAMIDGISRLIAEGVNMINLSIGDEYYNHRELEIVCREAHERGILIVAAYSNRDVLNTFPASFPFVLGVRCNDQKNPKKIMQYNSEKNDLCFTTSYFSLYHLEIPRLLNGNSFACAKVSGLLSHYIDNYRAFLMDFEKNVLNVYYAYEKLKRYTCCFLSNRLREPLEQRFMREVTNTVITMEVCAFLENSSMVHGNHKAFDILFMDCDSYGILAKYKENIKQICRELDDTEVVCRYPLYSLYERIKLQQNGLLIQQFYI